MKKGINLFRHRKKPSVSPIFILIRNLSLIGASLSFIAFIFINSWLLNVSRINVDLLHQKKVLLEDILKQKDNEAKINFFKVKLSQLENFSKDNAYFKPLYFLLKDSFIEASGSSTIDELSIDNKKKFSFKINLEKFEDFVAYVNTITTPKYVQLFDELNVSNFSYEGDKTYSLVFSGTLK